MKRSMYVVLIGALLLATLYTAVSIVTINSEAKEVASATDAAEELNAINIVKQSNKRSWDSIAYDPTKSPQIFETTRAMAHKVVFTEAEAIEPEPEPEPEPKMTYLGVYTLTAYEYTGNPTASGDATVPWWTVACNDPALWMRKIHIKGYGDFLVCDRGGMPSFKILDIYLGDYNECIQFGVREAEVYVYE